jgi:AcrR family transcriptional regulator
LIQAAKALVADGLTPTIEESAAEAGVSRPTAYRYFPNQRALLAAAHPETTATSLLPADPPADVAERLALVIQAFIDLLVDTEAQQRTMLRLSLEADPAERAALPLRQGRAIGWFEEALAPLQLPDDATHRLAVAIRSAVGIESLAWLTDIGRLSREDAIRTMSWSAQAMLQSALAGNLPPETST